jgi:hypothetical protein
VAAFLGAQGAFAAHHSSTLSSSRDFTIAAPQHNERRNIALQQFKLRVHFIYPNEGTQR